MKHGDIIELLNLLAKLELKEYLMGDLNNLLPIFQTHLEWNSNKICKLHIDWWEECQKYGFNILPCIVDRDIFLDAGRWGDGRVGG